jgi:hypothetical protein
VQKIEHVTFKPRAFLCHSRWSTAHSVPTPLMSSVDHMNCCRLIASMLGASTSESRSRKPKLQCNKPALKWQASRRGRAMTSKA